MMLASVLAASMMGSFSGVDLDRLLDTPHLKQRPVFSFDAQEFARQARGAAYDADARLARVSSKDFAFAVDVELPAGAYQLEVACLAPSRGGDVIMHELDTQYRGNHP